MNENELRQRRILIQEAEKGLKDLKIAYRTIIKEFVNHKIDLIKDINIITAILIPAFLVFVKEEFIKSIFFFWLGIIILVLLLFINLFYRRSLFSKEEELLKNIEKYGQKLQNKIVDCKKENKREDFDILDKILADSFEPLVTGKNLFQKYGEIIIYLMFVLGILFLTLSLVNY